MLSILLLLKSTYSRFFSSKRISGIDENELESRYKFLSCLKFPNQSGRVLNELSLKISSVRLVNAFKPSTSFKSLK